MASSDLYSRLLMTVAVGCAVVVTATSLVRTNKQPQGRAPEQILAKTLPDSTWQSILKGGHEMGPSSAPLTIVEFADFECPACRAFITGALAQAQEKHPDDIRVIFHHWPLKYHKFAHSSAIAAECAGAQGQFAGMYTSLYARQDSLGLKSWESYARDSKLPDIAAFNACVKQSPNFPQIDADERAAISLGGRGTPTVIVNGTMLAGIPTFKELDSMATAAATRRGQ